MISVRLEHVSKQFALHRERPRSFQELFLNVLHLKHGPSKEKHWALRDVSFEVGPGQMLGVVGDNGAGKSTLLKLLSRIIEPTSGRIELNGRVGALLELGAGFHPDLTGRENVYLNGSILGFSKAEMARIFDDVVSFSEMEHFIDVPVKHYSSGMFMRLGFSVAIHLHPDILLVDEVLAVGDQAFQLRCLDRIREMKRQGVTIILVSHDQNAVRDLCNQALWLKEGQVQAEGPVERVLEQYATQILATDTRGLQQAETTRRKGNVRKGGAQPDGDPSWRWGSREAEIAHVQFLDAQGQERRSFATGETLVARLHFAAHERIEQPLFGVALYHADGFHISGPNTGFADYPVEAIQGQGYIDYIIPHLPLLKGTYLFSATIYDHAGKHAYDHQHQAYTFRVTQGGTIQERYGALYIPSYWQLGRLPALESEEQHGGTASQ